MSRPARRRFTWAALIWGVPATTAIAYLIAFVANLPSLLAAVYASSDTAIAPYLTQMWLRAPVGSRLLMGHAPFYSAYWLMRLLHYLPDYHVSWEIAPWILFALASLAAAWGVARTAGRVAGLLAGAALLCAGTYLLDLEFSWSVHGFAYVNVTLLGAFLVWLCCGQTRSRWLWPLSLLVTLMTAASLATDELVTVGGLVPFAVTALPLAWLAARDGRRHVTAAALSVTGGSIVGALVVNALMKGERLYATPSPTGIASIGSIPAHLLLLVQNVYSLLGGYLHEGSGMPTLPRGALGYICSLAITFLLALAVAEAASLVWWLVGLLRRRTRGADQAGGVARRLHTAFWLLSALATSAAYVGTTVAIDVWTRRYLVAVSYAIVVLGICRGASGRRRSQVLTGVAVTILVFAGLLGLVDRSLQKIQASGPSLAVADSVKQLAGREHTSVIYVGYWDSYSLGWLMDSDLRVEPVYGLQNTLVADVAVGSGQAGIVTAHLPHERRSMLLLNSELDASESLSNTPPTGLGPPAAHFQLGGQLTAYVYDYDIATRFRK